MRKKNLFVYALASLAMFGCSQSNLTDDDDGGKGGGVKGEEAWIVLNVQKSVSGRSLNNPEDQHNGLPEETNIKTVKAIFFNGFSDYSAVSDIVDLTTNFETGGSGSNEAFKISTNSKSVLIVVNPTAALNGVTRGLTYAAVNKITAETVDGVTKQSGTQNYFLMTNSKGGLEPSITGGADGDLSTFLYDTKDAAESGTPLTIRVDRVVSKVRVDAKTATSAVANITDIYWTLNITNKKFFPVSKRQRSWYDTNVRVTELNKTWSDQYFLGSYRVDPNYDNTLAAWGSSAYDDEYNYYTNANANTINWIAADKSIDFDDPDQNDPNWSYCLENTQNKDGNYHAYTTHALLKVKFMPKEYTLPDGTKTSAQESNSDWININGAFYTYTTLLAWIKAELIAKYSNPAGKIDTYQTHTTTAFQSYLAGLAGSITAPTIMDETAFTASGKSATEAAEDITDLFSAQKANVTAATNKSTSSTADVKYYSGGINYYQIMIKHDDTEAVSNELGEFGVVRNALYDITVSKIENSGTPSIPDPDPTKPDESKNWLKVDIKVNPWTWYKQTEIL